MRIFNSKELDAVAMTGTTEVVSEAIWLGHIANWSVQLDWTRTSGSLTGAYKIQVSNTPTDTSQSPKLKPAAPVVWTDLAGATGTVTDASSGSAVLNLVDAGYLWARIVYTNSTGVGVLNARVNGKGL